MKTNFLAIITHLATITGLLVAAAHASFNIESDFAIIDVNPPAAPGMTTNRLGEAASVMPIVWDWNSGNLLAWSGSGIFGLAAAGGAITGSGTAASPYLELTGFSGPDLDFGYSDFLQIRLRLPAGFNGDVIFRFGTSTEAGNASTNREFRIPNHRLINDGGWHTYRIDLGLLPRYRDQLTSLRIYPLGNLGNGATFEIDYVELGDLPGDLLLVNTAVNRPSSVPLADVRSLESKHAVIWWAEGSGLDPATHGRRALRMIEESHQVYTKILGYKEPFESWDLWRRDGNRYKVNHVTWYDGFWMGGHQGFGHFNVSWHGLQDEGWGNPVPHEYGHVVQGHQLNFLAGGHWESHANYLRQAWQMHYAYRFPEGQKSQLSLEPLINSNYRQDHGRLIYADFRIHHALESLTEIGLDWNLAARLWFEGTKDATCYTTLAALLPPGHSVADVVARGLSRWPFFDFEHGAMLKDQHWRTATDKAWHDYITGSLLIPSHDRPGWWRVPFARAPERFAHMYHELDVTASTVTVELRGIDVMGTTEGWRWSMAAVNSAGNVRYSEVMVPGTHSMALLPGETKAYLIVVATPTNNSLNLEWTDNRLPTDRHADRLRYPYEVRIVGAQPARRQLNWNTASGTIHPNGGGWKANTATVHPTAYLGPNARVLGSAQIRDHARIEDYAVVAENAIVRDQAVVSGYAVVRGSARINHRTRVRDRAVVGSSVQLRDNAMATEYARPDGSLSLSDDTIARGQATSWAGNITGHAILDYDGSTGGNFSNGVQFAHVPWGDWYVDYWWNTKAKPRGLVASYRIDEPEGQVVWDEFGVAHALLQGNGQRVSDPQMFTRVMRLDGTSAHLVLDRNLCAMRSATYSLWVKPNGANTNRSVLFMGGGADRYLRIVARDNDGRARVRISAAGSATEWISQSVVPAGGWTNLAITFDAATNSGTLYINGQVEDTRTTTLLPEDVLGPNDYVTGEALYIGRDWDGNLFAGDVVDMRFSNVALSAAEIAVAVLRSGSCIGAFFTDAPMNFNGSDTEFQSGVTDGLQRVLKATIFPRSPQPTSYYGAVFDSSDERTSSIHGSGFGLRNSRIWVRLANVGFWDTGVNITLNQWQTVTLTYNGTQARLFIDGVQRASRNYTANQSHVAGKNFRIGFAQSAGSGSPKFHFNGEIRDAYIYDNVDVALQSAPAAPASISYPSASASGQYTVTWPAVTGATTYQLQRSADAGATWVQVFIGSATSFDEFVGSGAYRYQVRAENVAGSSTWRSGTNDCVVTVPPPAMPAAINQPAFSTTGEFSISWDPVDGAESYELERSLDGGTTWTPVFAGLGTSYAERAITVTPPAFVSVNFDIPNANTGPYQPGDVGGVLPLANWNNIDGRANAVAAGGLVTSTGAAADGLELQWTHTAVESWNTGAGGNVGVYGDFIRIGPNEFRILGIPRTYDLIIYAQDWGSGNPMAVAVNGVTKTGTNTTTNQTFAQDGYIENDNYFAFAGASETARVTIAINRQLAGFQLTLHGVSSLNEGAYRYRVRATSYAGATDWTTATSDTMVGMPVTPEAPGTLAYPTESTIGSYQVTWSPSAWAEGYVLERSGNAGATWEPIHSGTGTSFDESVASGYYRYRVSAFNIVGASGWRTGTGDCRVVIPAPPDTPAAITYPAASETGRYTVGWVPSGLADTYQVERSADGGSVWEPVYAGAAISFGERVADGTFRYRVRALNSDGESDWHTGIEDCLVVLSALEHWRREHFSDAVDSDDAGPDGDPDQDGVTNLMEFALRGDPLVPSRSILPTLARAQDGRLVYRFRVRGTDGQFVTDGYHLDGIGYHILRSDGRDGGGWNWDIHPLTEATIAWGTDPDEAPVLELEVDPEVRPGIGFFKLRVTKAPSGGGG